MANQVNLKQQIFDVEKEILGVLKPESHVVLQAETFIYSVRSDNEN